MVKFRNEARLKKLAQVSAWALLALVLLTAIAGYGITNTSLIYRLSFELIDRGAANSLHRWSQPVLAAVVLTHILTNIRLRLPRAFLDKILLTDSLLVIIGLTVMGIVLYLAFNP
jgi:hypothetical protein